MVITSTPLEKRKSADVGVIPLPSDEFSPFAITKSTPFSFLRLGSLLRKNVQPILPTTSPIARMFIYTHLSLPFVLLFYCSGVNTHYS